MELLQVVNIQALDRLARQFAVVLVGGTAAALVLAAALGALNILPWPDLYLLTAAGEPVAAGKWAVIGGMVLVLAIAALLPGSLRVLQLERMHRDFRVSMEDVTRAYWLAHSADRAGTFKLAREFDAVRERFRFLRDHPDLEDIQPELLELAAQMGAESRDLARIYSDTKVARAQEMLELRRFEAAEMQERVARAMAVTGQIKRLLQDVEMDEAMARSALARLREELDELMPKIETVTPTPQPPKRPRLRVASNEGGS